MPGAVARTLPVAVPVAVAAGLALVLLQFPVDVLYWDEWAFVPLVEHFSAGTLRLEEFFARYNEHRMAVPRLLVLGLAWLTGWDPRAGTVVSLLCAAATLFSIDVVAARTSALDRRTRGALAAVAALMVFSPVQGFNWTMGIGFVFFIPCAAVSGAVALAVARVGRPRAWALAALLCLVASLTMAGGLVSWAVVGLVVALMAKRETPSGRVNWIAPVAAWGLAAAAVAGWYLLGTGRVVGHPEFVTPFEAPSSWLGYVACFVGSPFAQGTAFPPTSVAVVVGAVMIGAYAALCGAAVIGSRSGDRRAVLVPWLAIGGFALGNAAIAAVFRGGFGLEQALASRYTTLSLLIPVSLLYAIAAWWRLRTGGRDVGGAPVLVAFGTVLGALLSFQVLAGLTGLGEMAETRQERLRAKAALPFLGLVPGAATATRVLHPDSELLRQFADRLDRLGMLRPPRARSAILQPAIPQPVDGARAERMAGAEAAASDRYGELGTFEAAGDGTYVASGWAALPARREPADLVLLACSDQRGTWRAIAVAEPDPREQPRFLWTIRPYLRYAGWSARVVIPAGSCPGRQVSAWAVDATTGAAVRLRQTRAIE